MRSTASSLIYFAAPLLLSLADALPHDDHQRMGMDMNMDGTMDSSHSASAPSNHTAYADSPDYPMSYFAHKKHTGVIMAHIVLMVIAWFFALPIGATSPIPKRRNLEESKT